MNAEVSRRNWRVRISLVIVMWAVVIAFFGPMGGVDFTIFLTFIAVLVTGVCAFYGWHSGRENKRKGV